MRDAFTMAVENISRYGDTDIFPYPFENHVFYDRKTEVVDLLLRVYSSFDAFLTDHPPTNENTLAPTGYVGFRWATQVDALWNAYLLGLVISMGPKIEAARLSPDSRTVFSYRYRLSATDFSLFDKASGWSNFRQRSLELAKVHKHVLLCDIADFYGRVYHHRLENALKWAGVDKEPLRQLMRLLQVFGDTKSYGLPVGGPAARLLSELVLNTTDKLLQNQSIVFCRFADDYHVFADSVEEAHRNLVFLSMKLLQNEGLSLQKSKTRIMSANEFIAATAPSVRTQAPNAGHEADPPQPPPAIGAPPMGTAVSPEVLDDTDDGPGEARRFLSLSIKFDPYSPTAVADYDTLKSELETIDVVGLLAREVSKSRLHRAMAIKLIKAVRFLSPGTINEIVASLVEPKNVDVIAPVFPSVMIMCRDVFGDLTLETRRQLGEALRKMIRGQSYVMAVDVNLSYTLRVLAREPSADNEQICSSAFDASASYMVRRDVILIMAKWNAQYWISDLRSRFRTLSPWERRAFIVASFTLHDEGEHWRRHMKREFDDFEQLISEWVKSKIATPGWEIPV